MTRSLRSVVVELHGTDLPMGHPLLIWMVGYAEAVIARGQLGTDGLTAYRRWKEKKFARALPPLSESVLYLPAGKPTRMIGEKWLVGLFRGHC